MPSKTVVHHCLAESLLPCSRGFSALVFDRAAQSMTTGCYCHGAWQAMGCVRERGSAPRGPTEVLVAVV